MFLFFFFFFFNDTATTEIYTLSLHDALPIFPRNVTAAMRSRPARACSRDWVRSRASPYQMPPTAAATTTTSRPMRNPRRASRGFFTGVYEGRGPGVTTLRLRGLLLPLIAMVFLTVHQAGHDDSALVEQDHGNHHRGHRVGVRARRDHCSEDRDEQDGPTTPLAKLLAGDHADDREEDQDHRELEGDPK